MALNIKKINFFFQGNFFFVLFPLDSVFNLVTMMQKCCVCQFIYPLLTKFLSNWKTLFFKINHFTLKFCIVFKKLVNCGGRLYSVSWLLSSFRRILPYGRRNRVLWALLPLPLSSWLADPDAVVEGSLAGLKLYIIDLKQERILSSLVSTFVIYTLTYLYLLFHIVIV